MNKSTKAKEVLKKLEAHYPKVVCALNHTSAFELLVATILSAQCTDDRVNKVTKVLFEDYGTPEKLANADLEEIIRIVKSTGFYNNKAKNIIATAKKIVEEFDGEVPKTTEELTTLHGVAKKTANVVLSNWYDIHEGIAVDTHVKRIAKLTGLTKHTDPVKVEKDLMKLFPNEKWGYISLALIQYGRDFCSARNHDTSNCFLGGHA